jgi:hypothetical protein
MEVGFRFMKTDLEIAGHAHDFCRARIKNLQISN